jgi:cellulose 1,4-beta-cellobiosidase
MLAWNTVTGATGYNVKSSLTSGGVYTVIATNLPMLTFTNTGLVNGTVYYYAVSTLNAGGESTNSSQVSARPVSTIPPTSSIALLGNQLQLSWPADHTGWRLQVNTNLSTTNWLDVAGASTTNQITTQPTNANAFFRLVYP